MTWFRRKVAVNLDTGEQIPVVTGMSDWEDSISPTIFFTYFDKAPVVTSLTDILTIMSLKDFMPQTEEEEEDLCL